MKACKGCGSTTRKLGYPGPRCLACHRAVTKERRNRSHALRIGSTYGLSVEDYQKLYDAQGGRCAICQKAKGLKRRLAVDHDHACCPEPPTCGQCTRGLLCQFCNHEVLGRLDLEGLLRAARYLLEPPAKKVLSQGESS